MSKSSILNPSARDALNRFKIEASSEIGINLKRGYGDTRVADQTGSMGGQMTKKIITAYENGLR